MIQTNLLIGNCSWLTIGNEYKVGVLGGDIFKVKKQEKTSKKRLKRSGAPWRMTA